MPNNIRNLGEAIVARRRPNPLRERIIAKAPIEQKTVKSAGRVLEILEYFDDLQRQSTVMRSEEHTSELQSLMRISYAVFCLKKKKNSKTQTYTEQNQEKKNCRTIT